MTRRARVFVSHSSHSPADLAWLAAFVAALETGDDAVEVLHDKEQIHTGDRWRQVINDMLYRCDAGVVLLTEQSVVSDWVVKEVNILRWRHDAGAGRFLLLPLSRGLTDPGWRTSPRWEPVDLGALQQATVDTPESAAAGVRRRLRGVTRALAPTPLDLIADDIVQSLASCSRLRWESAWHELAEPFPTELVDRPEVFALALARWMLRREPPALTEVAGVLGRLGRTLGIDHFRAILRVLEPLWVDPVAAAALSRAGPCHVALPCNQPQMTVRHFVTTAHLAQLRPHVFVLNGVQGGHAADAVERELLREVREVLQAGIPEATDEDARAWLRDLPYACYAVLPTIADEATVRELRSRFGRVTFVHCHPQQPTPAAAGIIPVRPPLDLDLEERVRWDRIHALTRFAAP